MKNTPDYKKIYRDIIEKKYPEKKEICSKIMISESLSILDVIKLNALIFHENNKENSVHNQYLRSYDKKTILKILDFQKKNHCNNSQLARHFKLSRNTVTKWKKLFLQ